VGPWRFWSLTRPELLAAIRGHARRMQRSHEAALVVAYQQAALTRAKRMPPVQRLLAPARTRKDTPAEMERRAAEHAEIERLIGDKPGD